MTATRRAWRLRRAAAGLALLGAAVQVAFPAAASAHPLGNYTINHYAGIRVAPDGIALDIVLDRAEVPAFAAARTLDTDRDGLVSAAEMEIARWPLCQSLASSLLLAVDDDPAVVRLAAAGLSLPPGAASLPTMRLVCALRADVAIAPGARIAFEDRSHAERIGWREIVVEGDGLRLVEDGGGVPRAVSPSNRLAQYPADLLAEPVMDESLRVLVAGLGPALPPYAAPDATGPAGETAGAGPLPPAASGSVTSGPASAGGVARPEAPAGALAPGGIGGELLGLLGSGTLTPLAIVVALVTAAALGAGHALTPGHGKTVMAAYLVGTRGSTRHALGLGLAVATSHTLGIAVVATIVVAAGATLPPEAFARWAPLVSAVIMLAIGAWMVAGLVRARRRATSEHPDLHGHEHPHGHGHAHPHPHGHAHSHSHPHGHEGSDPHPHDEPHDHPTVGAGDRRRPTVTWRSLAILGLAGGLIPSTNALLLLLAALATGRPAWGLVLVVAFGLGMAAVMAGIGILLVHARGLAERGSRLPAVNRVMMGAPVVGAALVLALGTALTLGAVGAVVGS